MNEAMIDLAHRVVACKGWRWLPGMADTWGSRVREGDGIDRIKALPNLNDPATLGCLLQLVREAWSDPTASTAATREADGKRGWVMDCWDPKSPLNGIGPFQSEAEALIAALEVAP